MDKVSGYPTLVTFGDIRDPVSVQRVDPDNFAATLGRGVKLRRITVERTDAPVTTGVEKLLPPTDQRGFFNWDGKSNPNEKGTFSLSDFSRGMKR